MFTPKSVVRALLAAATFATAAQAGGNAASGAIVFPRCDICHTNTKGAGARIEPGLFGVAGRKAGTEPSFFYSAAMKAAGFVWTNEMLDAYVKAPQQIVPGNKMPFSGLPGATQRADLIAYLDTLK